MKKIAIVIAVIVLGGIGAWGLLRQPAPQSSEIPAVAPAGEVGAEIEVAPEDTGRSSEVREAPPEESVPPPDDTASDAPVKEFTVTGQNFVFIPSVLSVKKGDRVRIVFQNTSGFHDLKIDEFAVATAQIQTGEEETVEFVADRAGTFEFYCSVGSHREMGMVGLLTVTE